MFPDHTQRRSTVGRTPLDEWSARRRDLYLTTHDTHNQTNIHAPGGIRNHLSRRAAAGRSPAEIIIKLCWQKVLFLKLKICHVARIVTITL